MLEFESLASCETLEQLISQTGRMARSLGFEHWVYTAPVVAHAEAGTPWSLHDCPQELRRAHGACARSARYVGYLEYGIPFWWTPSTEAQAMPRHDAAEDGDALFEAVARRHGVSATLCTPIHGPGGRLGHLLLVARGEMTVAMLREVRPATMLFSRYLHQACLPHIEAQQRQVRQSLSPREVECMSWAVMGKTAWEISRVLHVSEHTVSFHLRNAATKLGAVNRQQAVAKWVQGGGSRPRVAGAMTA